MSYDKNKLQRLEIRLATAHAAQRGIADDARGVADELRFAKADLQRRFPGNWTARESVADLVKQIDADLAACDPDSRGASVARSVLHAARQAADLEARALELQAEAARLAATAAPLQQLVTACREWAGTAHRTTFQ